jgi:hypothetical protein
MGNTVTARTTQARPRSRVLDPSLRGLTVVTVNRKSVLAAVVATLTVGFAAVVLTRGLLAPGAERTTTAAREAVADMLTRCGVEKPCLRQETIDIVSAFGAEAATDATLTLFRENPSTRPPCHTYMHILGGSLTSRVVRGDIPDVGTAWTECGAGLIHGAFENISVDGNDARKLADVLELCEADAFSSAPDRYHACIHAVGHGVHTGVGGDIPRGELVCAEALDRPEFATNNPCLAGVYMADRDGRLATVAAPEHVDGWTELLSHCRESPQPATCAMAYAEIFVRGSENAATSYLDWCLAAGVAPEDCLRLLGQGGAVAQIQNPDSVLTAALCVRAAEERKLEPSGCYDGIRNVFRFLSRTPEERIDGAMCELLEADGAVCPEQVR